MVDRALKIHYLFKILTFNYLLQFHPKHIPSVCVIVFNSTMKPDN